MQTYINIEYALNYMIVTSIHLYPNNNPQNIIYDGIDTNLLM